ncbi:unnamed protein product [Pleuronectes platessa]|uniref:Retinoic acid receptor alpha n=1 Tax=Pleuronectes platessa TaxID=8262 RepID=A0A9N7ZC57_PLEPL|nr:unnamed protein product [Pleuronectes platessa]
MAGKGNPLPGPHLNGFPMPTYSYFFPHMLGSLSPPALPGLSLSGYSTPSPASNVSAPSCSLELGSRVILARCPDRSVKKEEEIFMCQQALPRGAPSRKHITFSTGPLVFPRIYPSSPPSLLASVFLVFSPPHFFSSSLLPSLHH